MPAYKDIVLAVAAVVVMGEDPPPFFVLLAYVEFHNAQIKNVL